jgi:uncharacterized protein YdaU (DUF1376 family)
VLSDFFIERDGLYFHKRCDFEIQRFKDKSNKATQNIKTRWNKNKGYGTAIHRAAIEKYGLCFEHRKSFKILPPQLIIL